MTTSRFWIALTGAAVLLALALVARSASLGRSPEPLRADLNHTFTDVDGRAVRLADYAGRPLIINFWATWCGPCRLEMPQLVQLSAKYKDRGVTIVGISVDDTPDQIRAFAAEYQVNYPMLVGRGHDDAMAALGYVGNLPMSVFVKADGTVSHLLTGIATTEAWERRIQALF